MQAHLETTVKMALGKKSMLNQQAQLTQLKE